MSHLSEGYPGRGKLAISLSVICVKHSKGRRTMGAPVGEKSVIGNPDKFSVENRRSCGIDMLSFFDLRECCWYMDQPLAAGLQSVNFLILQLGHSKTGDSRCGCRLASTTEVRNVALLRALYN